MSAPIAEPVPVVVPATGAPAEPVDPPATDPKPTDTVEFWKRKAREQEDRAKSNADAARKLKEIEDRDLTELQRARKDAEVAASDLAELRRQNTLLAKGIPADLIPPRDASQDDLTAYADRLLAWRGGAAPAADPVPPQPKPDQAQGPRPLDPTATDEAEFQQHAAQLFPNRRK